MRGVVQQFLIWAMLGLICLALVAVFSLRPPASPSNPHAAQPIPQTVTATPHDQNTEESGMNDSWLWLCAGHPEELWRRPECETIRRQHGDY